MSESESYDHKRELRRAVDFFTGFLIAIAFHEAGHHTSDALKRDGLTLETFVLPAIFFLTALRFFIGNQLYLLKQSFARQHSKSWYYDVGIVTLQSSVLIFLGNVVTFEEGHRPKIGFVKALVFLYAVDVFWIVSKMCIGRAKRWAHCKPASESKWWVALNVGLVGFILLTGWIFGDVYSHEGLILIGIANAVAFVIDVRMTDLVTPIPVETFIPPGETPVQPEKEGARGDTA
jgi:hypothetical protein